MGAKRQIDILWSDFRKAINQAYAQGEKQDFSGAALRDYAENISCSDNTAALLGRETANERQHRRNRPSVPGFSVESAAKLILINHAAEGSKLDAVPDGTMFLICCQTAAEARVIGFLVKDFITSEWRDRVSALDYSKLMQWGRQ